MSTKLKLVVVVGPTASGKSELAIRLAKKYNGEIISADSRQVYKDLDVGTNKVPGRWEATPPKSSPYQGEAQRGEVFIYKGIPHHCIDFVDIKKNFTVTEFKKYAEIAINDLVSRNKLPILVGGTGLYIDAVVDGLVVPEVPPNPVLRKKLEQKSASELFHMLQKKDPARAAFIDQHNSRRLIRALEIIAQTKKPIPDIIRTQKYKTLLLGVYVEPEVLTERIQKRVQEWLAQSLVQETKTLRRMKLSRKRIAELGFNYKYVLDYLDKKITKTELAEILAKENWRYVKRQITWFKRNKKICWVSDTKAAEHLLKEFLKMK